MAQTTGKQAARHVMTVVAVALTDADGRVLVQQRPTGKAMAGLWEFPGGKVEPGETPEAALVRELDEELGIAVAESDLAASAFTSQALADGHMVMLLFCCRVWQGEARPLDADALLWRLPDEMADLPMPPADRPLVDFLKR